MIDTVNANLLKFGADVIVQQCNAVTLKSHGLSAEIAKQLPYANLYERRVGSTPNTATKRDEVGRAILCKPLKKSKTQPIVACLIAQLAPGKPGVWCDSYNIPASEDTAKERLRYFRQALADLRVKLTECDEVVRSIAFPDHIGCGLAGGDWSEYLHEIKQFAQSLPSGTNVTICKLK